MMKKLIFSMAIAIATANDSIAADFIDVAQVIGVDPVYTSKTQQECHVENGYQDQGQGRGNSGAVIGGVAGGILGNQVGGGNGKVAATALGAVLGALTGDRVQNDGGGGAQQQQRRVCTDQPVQAINGYRVRYRYQGREGNTVVRQPPGETIRVGITAIQN